MEAVIEEFLSFDVHSFNLEYCDIKTLKNWECIMLLTQSLIVLTGVLQTMNIHWKKTNFTRYFHNGKEMYRWWSLQIH